MTYPLTVTPLFIFLALASCGGGGSGGLGGQPSNDAVAESSTVYPLTQVNGSLEGTIWIPGDGAIFDLGSGEYRTLSTNRSIHPSRDGQEYLETVNEHRTHPGVGCRAFNESSDSILIRDTRTGLVKNEISAIDSGLIFLGAPQISPDGLSIATFTQGDDWCNEDDYRVTILDRSGNTIIRANTTIKSVDWLPDNRLVMAIVDGDRKIISVESTRHTLRHRTIANLQGIEGQPRNLRVNTAGTRVLFEMVTNSAHFLSGLSYRDATAWQVNIDGTELQQIFDTSRQSGRTFEDARVNSPIFSPDDQWLLATENYLSGANVTYHGTVTENMTYIESVSAVPVVNESLTYIMPADFGFQRLPPASYDVSGVRPLMGSTASGRVSARGLRPYYNLIWTPTPSFAAEQTGGFQPYNGRPNRNLPGTIYFTGDDFTGPDQDKPQLHSYQLLTGIKQSIFLDTSSIQSDVSYSHLAISADGQTFAVLDKESFDSTILRFYSGAGVLQKSIDASDLADNGFAGSLQFSPVNSNLIAFTYRNLTENTVVVVYDVTSGTWVTKITLDNEAGAYTWSSSGDLLITENSVIYRSQYIDSRFLQPEPYLELAEVPESFRARLSDNRIVYGAQGKIYSINSDGTDLVKVAESADGEIFQFPSWSSDGQFILIESDPITGGSSLLLVGGNAQNLVVYSDLDNRPGYMWLGENAQSTGFTYADGSALLR